MSVSKSIAEPIFKPSAVSTRRAITSSWIDAGTNNRVPEWQIWPECRNVAQSDPAIAMSRSASSSRMFALLPPSSSVTFFTVLDASCMMRRPTSVDPVNATLSTIGFDASSSPAAAPAPGTTLITPGGNKSVSCKMRANSSVDIGVYVAGLITIELPVASAGAAFHIIRMNGKFHGVIAAVTPYGSRRTMPHCTAGKSFHGTGSYSPIVDDSCARMRQCSTPSAIENRLAMRSVCPASSASIWESTGKAAVSASHALSIRRDRSSCGISAHTPESNAFRAASIPRRMSSLPPRAT